MEKRIIVSISYQNREQDFELPSGTPLGSLDQKLRDLFPKVFEIPDPEDALFFLKTEEGFLSPEYSLAEQGIRDGSLLKLVVFSD